MSLSWLLLLLGATAATLALSRPIYYPQRASRDVAVVVVPSAELGSGGLEQLKAEVRSLLGRLDEQDRVAIVLPSALGGVSDPMSPSQAASKIDDLGLLPVSMADVDMAHPPAGVQHSYVLAPAGFDVSPGPAVSIVSIRTQLSELAFTAMQGAVLTDGTLQVFVRVRNYGPAAREYDIWSQPFEPGGSGGGVVRSAGGRILSGQSAQAIIGLPPAAGYRLFVRPRGDAATGDKPGPAQTEAFLVQRPASVAKVAIVGQDEPLIRRFIAVHPGLELAATPQEADVVVMNHAASTASDKPSLVIAPAGPPPGYEASAPLENVLLSQAAVAGHEVTAGLDLAGVAVRRLVAWKALDDARLETLVTLDAGGVVAASSGGARPRMVFVSFDISPANSTLWQQKSFVVLLSNIFDFLSPARPQDARYEYRRPQDAGGPMRPIRQATLAGPEGAAARAAMLAPGLYADDAGQLHAVTLMLDVPSHAWAQEAPSMSGADAPLPRGEFRREPAELWPAMLLGAMLLWLAGWIVRLR